MKSGRLVLGSLGCVLGLMPAAADAAPLTWTLETALPSPDAQRLAIAGDDNDVYLFGGRGNPQSAHRYDPQADTYTPLEDLPMRTMGACGDQMSDGRFVVFGGFDQLGDSYVNTTQIYDAMSDSWEQGATATGRWACAAVADGQGRLHVFGGQNGQRRYDIYDLGADSWSMGPMIPDPQRKYAHGAMLAPDGRFYLFGGRFSEDTWSIFDPALQTWTLGGDLPGERVFFAFATDGDFAYVMGGTDNAFNDDPPFYDSVWVYDLVGDTWSTDESVLPVATREAAGVYVDGSLHVFGGSDSAMIDAHQVAEIEPSAGDDSGSDSGGSTSAAGSDDAGATDSTTDGGGPGDGSGGTGGPSGTTGNGGTGPGGGTGDDTGSAGGTGSSASEVGCGCAAPTPAAPRWGWLTLAALACGRRRAKRG